MMTIIIVIALVIIFTIGAILTEVECFGWATLTLLATIIVAHFLHIFSMVEMFRDHAGEMSLFIWGYVIVGVIWSFIKWFSFLIAFRDVYRLRKEKFMQENNSHETGLEEIQFLADVKFSTFRDNQLSRKPIATRNKSRIIAWMSFWPFSMAGTIINDPVRRFFNFLFNQFKALYQRMSDKVFASHPELK